MVFGQFGLSSLEVAESKLASSEGIREWHRGQLEADLIGAVEVEALRYLTFDFSSFFEKLSILFDTGTSCC